MLELDQGSPARRSRSLAGRRGGGGKGRGGFIRKWRRGQGFRAVGEGGGENGRRVKGPIRPGTKACDFRALRSRTESGPCVRRESRGKRFVKMRFPPTFLDDIRARIPISQVVGRKCHLGQAEIQSRPRRLLGLLPLPWREDAVLPCRQPQGPLPLFRLRSLRRSFHLPGRAGGAELSRCCRPARRRGRHSASRTRPRIARGARRSAPACTM